MEKYQSLNGFDLVKMYGGSNPPNIWTYKDIHNKSIDKLLGQTGKCIILFLNSENYGHWCALYRNRYGINFFDSYGNKPDSQYDFIPQGMAKSLNGYIRELTSKLYGEKLKGIPVHYNDYRLQDWNDKDIATCGRWCVVRLQYPEISVKDFGEIFLDRSLRPDDIVVELT